MADSFSLSMSCVASSADGTKLVAVVYGGQIYTSIDSGVTWLPCAGIMNWMSVASSADGTKLVAAVGSGLLGQIYTSVPPTGAAGTTVTSGYLTGGQATVVELQYVSPGQFLWLGHEGTVFGY